MFSEYLLDAKTRDDLTWNDNIKRYVHSSSNKIVSEREMYGLLQREAKVTKSRLDGLVTDLLDGKISFENWQKQSATIIKDAHVAAVRLGRGGRENTYGIHYLAVANELKNNQYKNFRKLAQQMSRGELSEKQIRARITNYGGSAKVSYEKARITQLVQKGDMWGRRRLGTCSLHCDDCVEYAERGWVPISQVVPPGIGCACRVNCCCSVETSRYRKENSKKLHKDDEIELESR